MTAEAKEIIDGFRALSEAARREVLAELVRISDASDDGSRRDAALEEDSDSTPLWQSVMDLGASLPPEEWDRVPADLAANLDQYLYGKPGEEE